MPPCWRRSAPTPRRSASIRCPRRAPALRAARQSQERALERRGLGRRCARPRPDCREPGCRGCHPRSVGHPNWPKARSPKTGWGRASSGLGSRLGPRQPRIPREPTPTASLTRRGVPRMGRSHVSRSKEREHPGSQPLRSPRPRPVSGRNREAASGPRSRYEGAVVIRLRSGVGRRHAAVHRLVVAPAPEGSPPNPSQTSTRRQPPRYRPGRGIRRTPLTARAPARGRTSQADQATTGTTPRKTAVPPPASCPRSPRESTTACHLRLPPN
jgi:hypothetical protein